METDLAQPTPYLHRPGNRRAAESVRAEMPAAALVLAQAAGQPGPNERRAGARFAVRGMAHALVRRAQDRPVETRGKSMGEIACGVFNAEPVLQGCICDISTEGVAFLHNGPPGPPTGERLVLDILMVGARFYLQALAFSAVGETTVDGDKPFDPFTWKRLGVKFERPTPAQRTALAYFIKHFCDRKTGGHHECIDVPDSGQRTFDPV